MLPSSSLAKSQPTRQPKAPPRKAIQAPGLQDLADRLSNSFDTRVKVELGRRKGRIVVEFASVDDLERIVAVMAPGLATRRDQDSAPNEP